MLLFGGWRASRTLSNRVTGKLISASRELTLTERGDLDSCLDLRSFGVMVVAMMVLLVGLSLAVMVRVVIPMVVECLGVGLILIEEPRGAMMNKAIFCNAPTARLLACLRCSISIVGELVHTGDDGATADAGWRMADDGWQAGGMMSTGRAQEEVGCLLLLWFVAQGDESCHCLCSC